MKIRKGLKMILTGVMVLGLLVACQTKEETGNKEETPEVLNKFGKTLVVYYSATGNTKEVADMIAKQTNGQLFEIHPKDSYSEADLDWTDNNSRVTKEHENESERNIELEETSVENWGDYETVFVGYPIWWGIAAWPIDNFIKSNDFSGKTVIPFCTSSSSGLGESGHLLSEMAGTGNWKEGKRFHSNANSSDVQEWLSE